MSKLLPCPFCGGKVERMGHAGGIEFFCGNHDCIVQPCTHSTNERDALAAWNTRPAPARCDELGRSFTTLSGEYVTRQNAEEVIAAKDARIAELENAIKVKGGNEHSPTQDAYDLACQAIEKHRDRADALETDNKRLREALERIKMDAKDRSEKSWYRLEMIADEARAALGEVKP